MMLSILSSFVLFITFFFLLQIPSHGAKQSYIVYMGQLSSDQGYSVLDANKITTSHFDLLASFAKSGEQVQPQIIYSYTGCMNGFAAVLDDAQVEGLRKHPAVKSVFLNRKLELHTTHSWNFLGLEKNGAPAAGSIWNKAKYGQDVVIANLDTGVWPESKSFSDEEMGPVPSRWRGVCQTEDRVRCNRKLIGARYFYKGVEAAEGPLNKSSKSARDTEGHGSHTLSTAGGSFVPGANIFGYANGTANGGSPKARVAAYKVCWNDGCFSADILAGFDAAINDGVDIISFSVGGPVVTYDEDASAIGSLAAIKKGITVIASGGNSGPDPSTISNVAPWFITVGASTMDRDFSSYVTLSNRMRIKGTSLSDKSLVDGKLYPLINAEKARLPSVSPSDAQLCKPGTLDPKKVAGKIIVCLRGENDRLEKGYVAGKAGAAGMILANDNTTGNEILADPHFLPASHITYTDGLKVFHYINSTQNPMGSISPVQTELGFKPAPVMAGFSSRGPNPLNPEILKPDITAPGVNVLAAFTGDVSPSEMDDDKRRIPFDVMSGTSMSCPHISGVVGLIKSIHPDWSPAAIRSAIMTTATTKANNKKSISDEDGSPATAFAYGAGHVRPNRAADPGLVYDLTFNDHLNFLCASGYNLSFIQGMANASYTCPKDFKIADFNYPSITVPQLKGSTTVTRKVKNVGSPGTYKVRVKAPVGISVVVEPTILAFSKTGEEKMFKVTLTPEVKGMPKSYVFGRLMWSDGKHRVNSPLVVKHV